MKLNYKNIITNVKSKFQSIRIKLFATLCASVAIIIAFLILVNSIRRLMRIITESQVIVISS